MSSFTQASGTSPGSSCFFLPVPNLCINLYHYFHLYFSQQTLGRDLKGRHWIHAFHHLTFTKRPLWVNTAGTMVNKAVLWTLKKGRQTRNHTTKCVECYPLGNTGCFTVQPVSWGRVSFKPRCDVSVSRAQHKVCA